MNISYAAVGFAAMMIAVTISVATADAINQPQQIAQAGGAAAAAAIILPEIVVHPDNWSYNPYTNGRGQKASSLNRVPSEHFVVPTGYDADVTMHPYTSGLGPCTEGASPSQGCRNATGKPIPPSHYERPPFNQ